MSQPIKITSPIRLKDFNPNFHERLDKEKAREKSIKFTAQIADLQELLHANSKQALLVVLQGMDTSGKDGATRHVLHGVNPSGVETVSFKVPSAQEMAHDFLWRIHKAMPRYGNIGVFNRSHYEDVLIVRVLNLQPPSVWRPRYEKINAFEKHLVDNRVILLKFFLHISKQEQAERLIARLDDPRKKWKFQPEDLKMRAHWPQFMKAYEDAINFCSTKHAPWHIVPANHKWYRDYLISKTVLKALEDLKLHWPKPNKDLAKFKIK